MLQQRVRFTFAFAGELTLWDAALLKLCYAGSTVEVNACLVNSPELFENAVKHIAAVADSAGAPWAENRKASVGESKAAEPAEHGAADDMFDHQGKRHKSMHLT